MEGTRARPSGQIGLNTLDLDPATLANPNQLRQVALACLAGTGDVSVNCLTLEYLDTGVVQVLLALARELEAAGRSLHLRGASDEITRWLAVAGLSALAASQRDGQ